MLKEKVLKTIQKYDLISPQDKIVIGVSGGPDSMCLLNILNSLKEKLKIEIIVAHVNHMIRKEADEETEYVENYCKNQKIPCYVKKVEVEKLAKEQKLGTEEMGRKIRYEFFEKIAQKENANKIATAHNANDNSETILMNFLRGTSLSGLKGIEIKRNQVASLSSKEILTYIRPLRECERCEIENYCQEHNLEPKIDQSNFENIYTRNKIRNLLIPYLQKEFNPNITETMNRLSEIATEEEHYFAEIVDKEYETLKLGNNDTEIILDLKAFNELPKVIKSRLILYTINKLLGSTKGIEKVHIEDMITLCEKNIGNKYLMPNKKIKIFVKKGKIFFISKVVLP